MLGWIKEKTTFAKIAGQWYDATNMNPGDNGQISVFASTLVKNHFFRAEDAWLTALVNWTFNSPYPEFRFLLANGIIKFLDIYEFIIPFDPEAKATSRKVANSIIQDGVLSGYPDSNDKNYFPSTDANQHNPSVKSANPGEEISLPSDREWSNRKPLAGLGKEIHVGIPGKADPTRSAAPKAFSEFKRCCHCGEEIKFEAEICGYPDCGLDPDKETMETYGITTEGERYKFLDHYFSKRVDAIKFAKMKLKDI